MTSRRAKHAWWSLVWSDTRVARPLHELDHRPAPDEVHAILDENAWRFTGDEDWELLAGNVIDPAWPAATDGPATRFYPPAIELTSRAVRHDGARRPAYDRPRRIP